MERTLFNLPPLTPASVTLTDSSAKPSPEPLALDKFMSMYKPKRDSGSSDGNTTQKITLLKEFETPKKKANPLKPLDLTDTTWMSTLAKQTASSEGTFISAFQQNSPPKSIDPKDDKGPCFNCYSMEHREKDCPNPKKVVAEDTRGPKKKKKWPKKGLDSGGGVKLG